MNINACSLVFCCLLLSAGTLRSEEQSLISIKGPMQWKVTPAPETLLLNLSPDKPGQRRWREFPGDSDEVYTLMNHNHKNRLRLSSFCVSGKDKGHLVAGRETNWDFGMHADDGEFIPLIGQIYRWDGKQRTLFLVPDHSLAIPQADGMRHFALVGTRCSLRLWEYSGIEVIVLEYGQEDPKRVKLTIHCSKKGKDGAPHSLISPKNMQSTSSDPDNRSWDYECWLAEGDHITTNDWDLELKRIVLPDRENHIRGWADFYLNPEPNAKR